MKSRCTPDSFNNIACTWNSRVNGDLATFLKDIQEKTGAVIESAVASSMVSSMNDISKKMDGSSQTEDVSEKKDKVKVPQVEDASDGEEEWSVVNGDDGDDEPAPTLSPVVLAKWDKELLGLHQLGFLDDVKNVDTLEHLEAAALGCDSTDEITVTQAVEHLLK